MWQSTLISKKYPPKFVYLMLKVTRRHIYTLRDSLDPLVKAATLLRLFSLPNGVFHLQFSNKKHYNLVLTTHLRYKKKSFSYLHLPSTTIIFLYLPSSTVIFLYPHSSHLPSSAFIYLYLLSFPFIDLHPLSSSFTWHILSSFTFINTCLHRNLPLCLLLLSSPSIYLKIPSSDSIIYSAIFTHHHLPHALHCPFFYHHWHSSSFIYLHLPLATIIYLHLIVLLHHLHLGFNISLSQIFYHNMPNCPLSTSFAFICFHLP